MRSPGCMHPAARGLPFLTTPRRLSARCTGHREIKVRSSAHYVVADLAGLPITLLSSPGYLIPALGGAFLSIVAAKLVAYSQLEVVRTTALSRYVPPGGARVLQLGGTTRDLFYYPPGTVQVTAVAPDVIPSLWEQAGLQAGVPVQTLKFTSFEALRAAAGSTVDAIVAFDQFPENSQLANEFFKEIWRVLKPGGVFVFLQRIEDGLLPSVVQGGSAGSAIPRSNCEDLMRGCFGSWQAVQWDMAVVPLDPHIVGIAAKPEQSMTKDDISSVDTAVFEQLMKKKDKSKGGKRQKGGFAAADSWGLLRYPVLPLHGIPFL